MLPGVALGELASRRSLVGFCSGGLDRMRDAAIFVGGLPVILLKPLLFVRKALLRRFNMEMEMDSLGVRRKGMNSAQFGAQNSRNGAMRSLKAKLSPVNYSRD
ncbi:hypothetical protein Ancab_021375 [Ancistrocladus abbreviatus]